MEIYGIVIEEGPYRRLEIYKNRQEYAQRTLALEIERPDASEWYVLTYEDSIEEYIAREFAC